MSEPQITPLARRLAEENGIDWRQLSGSGPEGTIVERDILAFLAKVMAGEVDLPPMPEITSTPAATPENIRDFAQAQAILEREGVGLGDLIPSAATPVAPRPAEPEPELATDDLEFDIDLSLTEEETPIPPANPTELTWPEAPEAPRMTFSDLSLSQTPIETEPPVVIEDSPPAWPSASPESKLTWGDWNPEPAVPSFASQETSAPAFPTEAIPDVGSPSEPFGFGGEPPAPPFLDPLTTDTVVPAPELAPSVEVLPTEFLPTIEDATPLVDPIPDFTATTEMPADIDMPVANKVPTLDLPPVVETSDIPELSLPPIEEPVAVATPAGQDLELEPEVMLEAEAVAEPIAVAPEPAAPVLAAEPVPAAEPIPAVAEAPIVAAPEPIPTAVQTPVVVAPIAPPVAPVAPIPAVGAMAAPVGHVQVWQRLVNLAATAEASRALSEAWKRPVGVMPLLFRATERALADLEMPLKALKGSLEGWQLDSRRVEPSGNLRHLYDNLAAATPTQAQTNELTILSLQDTPFDQLIFSGSSVLSLGRSMDGLALLSYSGPLKADEVGALLRQVAYYLERPILLA